MSEQNHLTEGDKETSEVAYPERRQLLKKAAYVAPAIMAMGVMTPLAKAGGVGSLPPPVEPSPLGGPPGGPF